MKNQFSLLISQHIAICSGLCTHDQWNILSCDKACIAFFSESKTQKKKLLQPHIINKSLLDLFQEAGFSLVSAREDLLREQGGVYLSSEGKSLVLVWSDAVDKGRFFIFHEIPGSAQVPEVERQKKLLARELQEIIDSLHDGIWVIDGQGMTVHVNKALKRIANIEPAEVVGRHVSQPISEGKFSSAVTLAALEQRKAVTMFDDYACGTRCLNTSTPIFDDEGNVWRVVASIRDMTELENLQKLLIEAEMKARAYKGQLDSMHQSASPGFIANSEVMRFCLREMKKAAKAPSGILLLGETGTGKTLAASLIHQKSPRAKAPFISVNCAAIPQSLIESELFGYEKGAFTGAGLRGKKGFFELADKGTLLLDEIGELPRDMQAKLLHVLDSQTFHKIGSEKSIKVDVRIIAATNRPLEQLVSTGEFRADLYYRLRVLSLVIPPLRDHPEDIPELATTFLDEACKRHGTIKTFSPKVLRCFMAHSWPGNVRELRAVVEFLAAMTEGSIIRLSSLPPHIMVGSTEAVAPNADENVPMSLKAAVKNLEKSMLLKVLSHTGSTYKAAKVLGISQSSVVRKAKRLGIGIVE